MGLRAHEICAAMTPEELEELIALLKKAKQHLVTKRSPLALRARIRDMRLVTMFIRDNP